MNVQKQFSFPNKENQNVQGKFRQSNLLTCASMSTEGYTGGTDWEATLLGGCEQGSDVRHSVV